MSDGEEIIVICLPTSCGAPRAPSERRECANCGRAIWLHTEMVPVATRCICMACAARLPVPPAVVHSVTRSYLHSRRYSDALIDRILGAFNRAIAEAGQPPEGKP